MNLLSQRALVLATAALLSAVGLAAPAGAALPAYKVYMKTSVASSTADHFITVSGAVVGSKAVGHLVTIQRHYVGTAWVTVATTSVRSDGTYAARVETPRGGTTSFRAIKSASSVRSTGVSSTRSIPVYRWLYLSDQPSESSNMIHGVSETIAGKQYNHSVEFFGTSGYDEWKLDSLCTKLTTVAAYLADSPDAAAADATLSIGTWGTGTPGTSTTTTVSSGTPLPLNLTETGTQFRYLNPSGMVSGYRMVLGDPKVYCNADVLPSWDHSQID